PTQPRIVNHLGSAGPHFCKREDQDGCDRDSHRLFCQSPAAYKKILPCGLHWTKISTQARPPLSDGWGIRETSPPVRTYVATGFMHVVCSSTDPFSAILRRAISASRHAGCFHHQQKCQ